ncbi:hypothetical protein TNCV_329901 [Trichonephila clavipes]|nr:hypothetical protein TNCV_329901 [Trichonephila clavipes]
MRSVGKNLRVAFEEVNKNVTLFSYSRALVDGSRNFEPWSSDSDNTYAGTPLPLPTFHTTPTGGRLSFDIFNLHRPPLHGGFLAVQSLHACLSPLP